MNSPTAKFFAVAHVLFDGDEDAIGLAYSLVTSDGFTGFGRARRGEALSRVAPELAAALDENSVDIIYVHAKNPLAAYRAVAREAKKAREELNGVPVPEVCVTLRTELTTSWPSDWRFHVWAIINRSMMDAVDRKTSCIPLPRDTREAIYRRQKNKEMIK